MKLSGKIGNDFHVETFYPVCVEQSLVVTKHKQKSGFINLGHMH